MVAVGFEEPLVQVMTAVLPAFGFSESTFNSTLSGLKRTWRVTLASRGAEVAGLLASHLHTDQQSGLATFNQVTKFCLSAFSNQESVFYGNYTMPGKYMNLYQKAKRKKYVSANARSGLILIYVCNGILHSELPVFEAVVSPVGYYDEV